MDICLFVILNTAWAQGITGKNITTAIMDDGKLSDHSHGLLYISRGDQSNCVCLLSPIVPNNVLIISLCHFRRRLYAS